MKLGIVTRMDNSGLGIQGWEACRHLDPTKIMLVEIADGRRLKQYPDRFIKPGLEVMTVGAAPDEKQVAQFLSGLDLVLTFETPYSYQLLVKARELGIKTAIQANYEFSGWIKNKKLPQPDVFLLPSLWHYDDFPDNKIHLPVPIATDRFQVRESGSAKKFLHVVGHPAANDRNGTDLLVASLQHVKSNVAVTIATLKRGSLDRLAVTAPPNVDLVVGNGEIDNYWDRYPGYDVLVMPRRYGGLCLPMNEAIGAGMPIITTDISPNNSWLDKRWLTPAELDFEFTPGRYGTTIGVYKTEPEVLAAKIDEFATDRDLYQNASREAIALRDKFSWDTLKSLYQEVFSLMLK